MGPHSHAGQKTSVMRLLQNPGGTVIRRFWISPKVTASRWAQIASRGHPSTKGVLGSRTCQKYRTNSMSPPRRAWFCFATILEYLVIFALSA